VTHNLRVLVRPPLARDPGSAFCPRSALGCGSSEGRRPGTSASGRRFRYGRDVTPRSWPSPTGGYLRSPRVRSWLSDAVERCQATDPAFPRVTAHDLRHTAASLAISAGANVKGVQRMLGHASAAMTLDVYADLFDADLDAVAVSVGNIFASKTGKGATG